MNKAQKLYYHLTAYLPRKLPTTEAEFMKFKDILFQAYDLKEEPATYATVAGQIQSTPGHRIRKSYGAIANQVKRLKINSLAQCYRIAAGKQLEHQLGEMIKAENEKAEKETLAHGGANVSTEPVQD